MNNEKKSSMLNDLIVKLNSYYSEMDKNIFNGENLIDCDFIYNLENKLDELEIEYTDSKVDFLAKHLLLTYNYDKACLIMIKKYLENPNIGKISNDMVFNHYLDSLNYDESKLRDVKDSYRMKAGNFSMMEKVTVLSNKERNLVLVNKYGVSPKMLRICFNDYESYSSCLRGAIEAVELKQMGIKDYHKSLLNSKEKAGKVLRYRKVVNQ